MIIGVVWKLHPIFRSVRQRYAGCQWLLRIVTQIGENLLRADGSRMMRAEKLCKSRQNGLTF
jgi:hypothetical protein